MRSLICTVLILFITAQTGLTSDGSEAQALLKTKLDAAIDVLQKKDLDPEKKNEQLVEIVTPMFNFRLIARLSLGRKHWNGLSEQKKDEFADLIFKRLRAKYLKALSLYTDEKVFFKTPVQNKKHKKRIIIPTILVSNDKKISINYRMYKSKKDWQIYDVETEGVSIIINLRNEYKEFLSKGTIDELLQNLEKPENK